jgi:hypothetical protein
MNHYLPSLIQLGGGLQLCILVASSLVPFRLDWKRSLGDLPCLHRQLFWIYGGYVVLGIVGLGLISLINPQELASGTLLARSVCTFIAIFWGVRLSLQTILDARPFLTTWWLTAGYHLLTLLFTLLTLLFLWAAIHPITT